MRILFLGNNWLGWQILQWLVDRGEQIVGLVMHPAEKQKFGDRIIEASGLDNSRILQATQIKTASGRAFLRETSPDIGISVLFDYLLDRTFLDAVPRGVINLHPSYLPFNRGQFPNVWSIVEKTPAGVTLHYIDEDVDTGDIIAQSRVEVEPADTGLTLYRRLELAAIDLFKSAWPRLCTGAADRIPQQGSGTYHRTRDVQRIDRIDLEKTYPARQLIDILRARTFPPYKGAYFEENGRRVYLRLELTEESP